MAGGRPRSARAPAGPPPETPDDWAAELMASSALAIMVAEIAQPLVFMASFLVPAACDRASYSREAGRDGPDQSINCCAR